MLLDLTSHFKDKCNLALGVSSQDSFAENLVLVYKLGSLLMVPGVWCQLASAGETVDWKGTVTLRTKTLA